MTKSTWIVEIETEVAKDPTELVDPIVDLQAALEASSEIKSYRIGQVVDRGQSF